MKLQMHARVLVFAAAAVLLVLGIGGSALAAGVLIYRQHRDTTTVRKIADALHLPAARVGSHTVAYTEYLAHVDAARRYLSGPAAQAQGLSPEVTPDVQKLAYERAIRIAAVEELADQSKLVVTPLDVDHAYDDLVSRSTSSTPEEVQAFLRDEFGWDVASFKQRVVRPALIEDELRQRTFQESGDAQAFDKTLSDLLNGEKTKRYLKF